MVTTEKNTNSIFNVLTGIKDPEIPVVNIVEMGIVRDVEIENSGINIYITPTYSACPAITEIKTDIERALSGMGYGNINVKTVLSPAWTTDWLSETTKQKLRNYGIAPPEDLIENDLLFPVMHKSVTAKCPLCGSERTVMKSDFGSTLCKSLYHCLDCMQPFEVFKCL